MVEPEWRGVHADLESHTFLSARKKNICQLVFFRIVSQGPRP
jgi:hypothetical protein